jgi:uncharacterized protein (DUF342 family)
LAQIIKTIKEGFTTINVWDTDNISIITDKPTDVETINKYLQRNQFNNIKVNRKFIDRLNENIEIDASEEYMFIHRPMTDDVIEYQSKQGTIRCSTNEMEAYFSASPIATYEKTLKFLEKHHVRYNLNIKQLKEKIESKDSEYFIISRGKKPKDMIPREYDFHYSTKRSNPVDVAIEYNSFFLDIMIENRVVKGDNVATIQAGAPATNGITISSRILPAKQLSDNEITIGKNLKQKGNDFTSTIEGVVFFSSQLITVLPAKTIRNPKGPIDLSYNGIVIVEGKLKDSTIKAGSDVVIHGTITNCTIECGGFFYFLSGIVGNSTVKAKHGIFGSFVDGSTLESSQGFIQIAKETVRSNLSANGPIFVRNRVLGGEVKSNYLIKVGNAGAENSKDETKLILNPLIQPKPTDDEEPVKNMLKLERNNLNQKLERTTEMLSKTKQLKDKIIEATPSDSYKTDEKYNNMVKVISLLEKDFIHINSRLDCLREYSEIEKNIIMVINELQKGVYIAIDDKNTTIVTTRHSIKFEKGMYGVAAKNLS